MQDSVVKIAHALLATVVIVSVVGFPFACTMHEDYQIAKMVEAGATPGEARCAIRPSSGTTTCVIEAAKGLK